MENQIAKQTRDRIAGALRTLHEELKNIDDCELIEIAEEALPDGMSGSSLDKLEWIANALTMTVDAAREVESDLAEQASESL